MRKPKAPETMRGSELKTYQSQLVGIKFFCGGTAKALSVFLEDCTSPSNSFRRVLSSIVLAGDDSLQQFSLAGEHHALTPQEEFRPALTQGVSGSAPLLIGQMCSDYFFKVSCLVASYFPEARQSANDQPAGSPSRYTAKASAQPGAWFHPRPATVGLALPTMDSLLRLKMKVPNWCFLTFSL